MPKPPNLSPFVPNPFKDIDAEAAAALKKATLAATALAGAFALAPKFPKTVSVVTQTLAGFEIVAGKGIVLKPSIGLGVFPQPIGLVPPRAFMLPEGMADIDKILDIGRREGGAERYFRQFPDQMAKNDEWFLDQVRGRVKVLTVSELVQQRGTLIRELETNREGGATLFQAQVVNVYTEELRARAASVTSAGTLTELVGNRLLAQGGAEQATVDATGQSPAELAALERQIGIVLSGRADPLGAPKANGSFHPENIEPVSAAARRSRDRAKGINRQLVSERADP